MHKTQNNGHKTKGLLTRAAAMLLVIMLLVQSLAFGCAAAVQEITLATGDLDELAGKPTYSINGVGGLSDSQITDELRNDIIKSFNKELVKKVDEYALTGSVRVIITFSDDSVVSAYTDSDYSKTMTYSVFRATGAAVRFAKQLTDNQDRVLARLEGDALIDAVEHRYVHIMDAASVTTTYENLEAIANTEGVERVMLSQTYLPQAAVNNPVDVYETGIFNSGSVEYTGKGTLVAVLDTGCDYSHSAFTSYQVQSPAYNRDSIASVIEDLRAYELSGGFEVREVYYGNITSDKIAYGYDYADKDTDIMPFENSHGTHVAGIIAGKDDNMTGVAIDAQLAIMKVFSDYEEGAKDDDILAALEDSVILGVDAINMSLGSSCGFTYESALDKQYKNEVYNRIKDAGISLVVAASNDYSSGFGNEEGDTNKTDNPDSATVGAPSTYDAAISVASINGNKDNYMLAKLSDGTYEIFFTEASDLAGEDYDFFQMLGIEKGDKVTYEYVTVPGYGMAINYSSIDVTNKIALVKRGEISFEEKVKYAQEAGAIAVIIYNNVFGNIRMTIGNNARIPAVSIGKDEGAILAAQSSGTLEFNLDNVAGPFMSDFSSWGPNPDLTLKPEITAHGGNIVSAVVGGEYDKNSGTSMAAPNMCGITLLIRQYVEENFEGTKTELRDLVYELCMSTATIALDRKGNPYSPRKQGAGIADIRKATTTPAYLYVEERGKTKLELGDDPERTGVYTMTVYLENVSDAVVSYKLGNITMTESVSSSDPEYVAEIAYLLSNTAQYAVEGGTLENGIVSVAAGKTAKITATITLSDDDKSYINSTFENGMYVEGYLTFDNTDADGVDLNAPFLAFYGDWGEAPIFDLDYYEVETEAHNNAIDDDDKIKADYYATTPGGTYYYDYIIPLGTYLYDIDKSKYNAIPATMDKAAISYYADSISGIYGVFTGLLRGAKELTITVTNSSTGEVLWRDVQYNCYKSHWSGAPSPYYADMRLSAIDLDKQTTLGDNNTKIEVTMSAKLDWDGGENLSDSYKFSFYIDYQPPTITRHEFRTEYDKSKKENRYYLDMWVYDNHYAMSCRPVVVYDSSEKIYDENGNFIGEYKKTYSSLCDSPIPIYQKKIGEVTKVTMEITDYLDLIGDSAMPSGITMYIDDYAMNSSVSYIPFPGTEKENEEKIEFVNDGVLYMDINGVANLAALLVTEDTTLAIEADYFKNLKWSIESGSQFVRMQDGQLEAIDSGTAIIKVTSDSWIDSSGTTDVPIYKTLVVNVSETVLDKNPDSSDLVQIDDLKFTHFKTLYAHNSEIDYSEIGVSGSTNYFGGNTHKKCYPGEKIQLFYELKPWNLNPDRCEFTWSSSNPSVATVDQNGVVTAEAKGVARITLNVKIDGRTSILAARMSLEVKSEFIIENRTLIAYKGKGGDVVIPEREGIIYIGAFAFSHFDLDNEKEVEIDENGYYDIDDKKTPLGASKQVTSVTVPEGVQNIQKYAFWGCTGLKKVVLPESCETISASAFENCTKLVEVNFDNVKIIANNAFKGCRSLTCEDLGGPNLEKVYAIGDYGFSGTLFESVKLPKLSRIGEGAFYKCTRLTEVELGQRTRISKKMFAESAIESIVIWSDTVSDSAFEKCTGLREVVFKNDLTYLGQSAFSGCRSLGTVSFEAGVEQIAAFAFESCTALKNLTLPNSAVSLGDAVFSGSGLKKLVFAENTVLTDVGAVIFENVSGVTFELDKQSDYVLASDGALYAEDGTVLVMVAPSGITSFTVPKEVVRIADGAFSSLYRLQTVGFEPGSALAYIGDAAFAGCTRLVSVNLPGNDIEIGDFAFQLTSALRSIDISSATEIGKYAFYQSAIESVVIAGGAEIGEGAFGMTERLTYARIGSDAVIGDRAFAQSTLRTVDLDGDASIGKEAFALCQSLTAFDFADVTGEIPTRAFWGCTSLVSVSAPLVTVIGDEAFADCYSLTTLSLDNVTIIGKLAFSTLVDKEELEYSSNVITEVNLPSLEKLGNGAFFASMALESVNMPSIKVMGAEAFYFCTDLNSVTLSDELEVIPDYAFYLCLSLSLFDVSNVVSIGEGAFYGVTLPEELVLPEAVEIDDYAFFLYANEDGSEAIPDNLKKITAPKLETVGVMSFAFNSKLESFSAPALREVGDSAFIYTALIEFGVGESFEKLGLVVFEGCDNLTAFYYENEDGEKAYDVEHDNVMIADGVLYTAARNGWALAAYPAAKDADTLTVAEGTVRINAGAAINAVNLKTVILPSTLKVVGNYAFAGCESLETVEFKSYYAPTLEGSMSDLEIKAEDKSNYPKFDLLYSYDYFYRFNKTVSIPFFYNNFVGVVGSAEADGLVAVIPDACEGYDALLYRAYFTFAKETGGVTVGKYAVAFIDAVAALPDVIDRFDRLAIEAAVTAYNAFAKHQDELAYITDEIMAKYEAALVEYNVDVASSKIDRLFELYRDKYSYDRVKDARATFLALTDEERALVENSDKLDDKITELNTVFGTEIDFELEFKDYAVEQTPDAPDAPVNVAAVILIVTVSALVLAAALFTIIFIRKKKTEV